jgi:anti-sigma regulatory factor (Ser/Thr protein kinase)
MPDRASITALHATPEALRSGFAIPAALARQVGAGLASACEQAALGAFDSGRAGPAPDLSTVQRTWTFPGRADQVRHARRALAEVLAGCPAADDIVLCLSELATNAARHSASARPGGTFCVTADVVEGAGVHLDVTDDGGPWRPGSDGDGRMHGLGIVRALAVSLSINGGPATGWTVCTWFGWHPHDSRPDQAAARP